MIARLALWSVMAFLFGVWVVGVLFLGSGQMLAGGALTVGAGLALAACLFALDRLNRRRRWPFDSGADDGFLAGVIDLLARLLP
jgi:hypothetical protein